MGPAKDDHDPGDRCQAARQSNHDVVDDAAADSGVFLQFPHRFGDVLGYLQSGIKDFKLADPVQHEDLFKIAEENIKNIECNEKNFKKYDFLL